jgi:hypothetical protein
LKFCLHSITTKKVKIVKPSTTHNKNNNNNVNEANVKKLNAHTDVSLSSSLSPSKIKHHKQEPRMRHDKISRDLLELFYTNRI